MVKACFFPFLDSTLKMLEHILYVLKRLTSKNKCMVDKSTLHLLDATASSTKRNVYVSTYGYFTLQRSQPQHTVDISISAEQRLACSEIIVQKNGIFFLFY